MVSKTILISTLNIYTYVPDGGSLYPIFELGEAFNYDFLNEGLFLYPYHRIKRDSNMKKYHRLYGQLDFNPRFILYN